MTYYKAHRMDDDKEAIQWYYFIALNNDNTIKHVWRVPGEMVEKDYFQIGLHNSYEFNTVRSPPPLGGGPIERADI